MKFWKKAVIGIILFIAVAAAGMIYLKPQINIEEEANIILNSQLMKGDYQSTVEQFEKLLTKAKKKEGNTSKNVVMLSSNIARLYIELGEFDTAEQYILDAKQISEEISLAEAPIDDIYSILGQLEGRKENYDAAINYFNEALKWRKKLYGENSEKVGVLCYQMAELSKNLGKYEEAKSYAKQGINSIDYSINLKINEANCHLLLGEVELEQENYEEALEWLNSCKSISCYAVDYQTPLGGIVFGRIYDQLDQAMSGIPDYDTSAILYTGMESYKFKKIALEGFLFDPSILDEQKKRVFELWKQDHSSNDTDEFEKWFQDEVTSPPVNPL